MEITQNEIKELESSLNEMIEEEEGGEALASLTGLLAMPDEEFMIIAPGILQSYQQSLNNPNDKITLVHALSATGTTVEDVTESFEAIVAEIDKMNISVIKRDFLKDLMASIANALSSTEGIGKKTVSIPIELCHEDAKIPQYAHISDSGLDVYAIEDIVIHPGETKLVRTGFKIALPPGYEFQVRPKSGRALKTKMRVANSPGTVDQEYRDEVGIIIDNIEPPIKDITTEPVLNEDGTIKYFNVTSIEYGSDMIINKGEKICQIVLGETLKAAFYRVDGVKGLGDDRGGGFGSTGLK